MGGMVDVTLGTQEHGAFVTGLAVHWCIERTRSPLVH